MKRRQSRKRVFGLRIAIANLRSPGSRNRVLGAPLSRKGGRGKSDPDPKTNDEKRVVAPRRFSVLREMRAADSAIPVASHGLPSSILGRVERAGWLVRKHYSICSSMAPAHPLSWRARSAGARRRGEEGAPAGATGSRTGAETATHETDETDAAEVSKRATAADLRCAEPRASRELS